MVAIPMKGNKNDSSITTVFGKCKYVALVDEASGEWSIKNIDLGSGRALASWLVSEGVKRLVVKDMGANPFMICQKNGIEVYFCDAKRATVPEIIEALKNNAFEKVSMENFNNLFEGKEHAHGHSHGDGHHHGHGKCCEEPSRLKQGRKNSNNGSCCGHTH